MASMDDHNKANGTRLCRLIIDKGTIALRTVFDIIHHPSNLNAALNSNRGLLRNLRCIGTTQTNILFPPGGVPATSANFDITLLFVLLRNICALSPPSSTGSWHDNPPSTDTSREANIVRIKHYRNVVYAHITTTGIDDRQFEDYWRGISVALTGLGICIDDIEKMKLAPLEEEYLKIIKEWKEKEDKMETKLEAIHNDIKKEKYEMDTKLEATRDDFKKEKYEMDTKLEAIRDEVKKEKTKVESKMDAIYKDVKNILSTVQAVLKRAQKQSCGDGTGSNSKKLPRNKSTFRVKTCLDCKSDNTLPRCYTI